MADGTGSHTGKRENTANHWWNHSCRYLFGAHLGEPCIPSTLNSLAVKSGQLHSDVEGLGQMARLWTREERVEMRCDVKTNDGVMLIFKVSG